MYILCLKNSSNNIKSLIFMEITRYNQVERVVQILCMWLKQILNFEIANELNCSLEYIFIYAWVKIAVTYPVVC